MPLTEDAADLIAVRADGGLRDALSLLDQCSSASEADTLDAQEVYDLLGLTGKDQIIQLTHHIFQGKSSETLTLFYDILQKGKEPAAILRDLLEHLRNMMICRIQPSAPELTAYGKNLPILKADASQISEPYLNALFDYLHQSLTETRRSSSPRMSAEMGLLHLCRLRGSEAIDSLVDRITRLEAEIQSLKQGMPIAATAPSPQRPAAPDFPMPPEAPMPMTEEPFSPVPPPAFIPPAPETPAMAVKPAPEAPVRKVSKPAPTPAPKPATPAPSPAKEAVPPTPSVPVDPTVLPPSTYPDIWKKVLAYFMSIRRIDIFTCLKKGNLIYCTKQRAVVSSPQQWLVTAGNNKAYQKIAAEAFEKVVGTPVMIHVVLQGGEEESDTLALLKSSLQQPAQPPVSTTESPTASQNPDGYHLIDASQMTEEDRNAPSFKEALKILPDCDIYEKG